MVGACSLAQGDLLGSIAPSHTSGLGEDPICTSGVRSQALPRQSYGAPISLLTLLPLAAFLKERS